MDCGLPGFSVHGIFQARVLEWVAISFSSVKNKQTNKKYIYRERERERERLTEEPVFGKHKRGALEPRAGGQHMRGDASET